MKNKLLYSTAIAISFSSIISTANAFDWSGFQIGLEGGYSKGSAKNVDTIKEEFKSGLPVLPEWPDANLVGNQPSIDIGNQPSDWHEIGNLPSFEPNLPSWPVHDRPALPEWPSHNRPSLPAWPDANIVGNQPGINIGNHPNASITNLPSISLPSGGIGIWPDKGNDTPVGVMPPMPMSLSSFETVEKYTTRELKSYQEGLIGGIYAGYNYQFDSNVVIGIVGDFIIGDLKSSQDSTFKSEVSDINTNFSLKKKYNANALLKAGYAFDNILPYVSAGVSYAKFDIGKTDSMKIDDAWKNVQNFYKDGKAGYVIGAGVDYALTDNIITKFEYRHSDYGTVDVSVGNETKIKSDDFIIGVAYKF